MVTQHAPRGVTFANEGVGSLDSLAEFDRAIRTHETREQSAEVREAYERRVGTAVEIVFEGMHGGYRGLARFREALGTGDFPTYFGDVIDRLVLARFTEWVPPFERYIKIGSFSDLTRNRRQTQFGGGNQLLGQVGQFGPYPSRGTTSHDYEWRGAKYGADMGISWETMLADDLNGLRDLPNVLASAARSTEAQFAASLYLDSNGPHASLYTVGFGNKGTAALSLAAVAGGVAAMSGVTDPDSDVPIFNRPRFLIVAPEDEITARGIVESLSVTYAATAGAATPLVTANIISKLGLEVLVDPWIPLIATGKPNSWFLFAEPNAGPLGPGLAAAEFDRLRGMERPLLLQERARFQAVGGGADPRGELNDVDVANFRVVHAMGGGRLFPQATYGSDASA
jgi:hypothetical protein